MRPKIVIISPVKMAKEIPPEVVKGKREVLKEISTAAKGIGNLHVRVEIKDANDQPTEVPASQATISEAPDMGYDEVDTPSREKTSEI